MVRRNGRFETYAVLLASLLVIGPLLAGSLSVIESPASFDIKKAKNAPDISIFHQIDADGTRQLDRNECYRGESIDECSARIVQERIAKLTNYVIGVGIIELFVGLLTVILLHKQTDILRRQMTIAHRPRLRLRYPELRHTNLSEAEADSAHGTEPIFPNRPVECSFTISNVGGTRTTIYECRAALIRPKVRVGGNPLDLVDGPDFERDLKSKVIAEGENIRISFVDQGGFTETEIRDFTNGQINGIEGPFLYLLGFVSYDDEVGIRRRTTFCRIYVRQHRTFRRFAGEGGEADNREYEYED